jgi:hypothetical protein
VWGSSVQDWGLTATLRCVLTGGGRERYSALGLGPCAANTNHSRRESANRPPPDLGFLLKKDRAGPGSIGAQRGPTPPAPVARARQPQPPRALPETRADLRAHLDGILAWARIRVANGALEGMNDKLTIISHRAFRYQASGAGLAGKRGTPTSSPTSGEPADAATVT